MTEEELKKLRAIAESRIGPEGVAPSDEDVMGGGAPPGIAPPPTPPQPSQSETKYGRMGVPMLPVNWRERGEAFTRGAASLIGKPFPYEFIRDYGHGGIPGVTEPTPEPPLDAGFLEELMTASQPELHAMGVYEDIVTPLYGGAAEITPKDWPALLGNYQTQADVSRGLGFAGVDVTPPDGFSPSEGWLFQDLRERIGELATPGTGVGELKARDQAYREALEAGDIPTWMDTAYRISVDPVILLDVLGLRKLAATVKTAAKLIPKTARTTIQSATDDALKLLKDKNVLPSQSYPQPMDPSVRADVDAIDKIIDQGRPAAAADPPTVTQPDVPVSPTTQPVQEGQMQFLEDPAAYAMPELPAERVTGVSEAETPFELLGPSQMTELEAYKANAIRDMPQMVKREADKRGPFDFTEDDLLGPKGNPFGPENSWYKAWRAWEEKYPDIHTGTLRPVPPADISTARTGRPFSGSLFRGSGRKTIEEVYDPHYVQGPIFGEATYSSPIREFAQEFGPQVDEIQINLRNPLVISSDQEWLVIRKEAGLFSSVPINPEEVTRLRQVIQNKGHDGVIIRVPDSEATGKSLQKAFGQDTVVDFTRAAPEEVIPPVSPAAKAPTTPKPLGRPSLIREAFVPEELPTEGLRTDPRGMRTTDPDAPLVERVTEADIEVFGETSTELNVTRMWEGGKETLDVRAIGERPANSKIFKVRITPYTPKGVTQTDSGAILVPDPDWMKDVFEGRFTEKLGKQAQAVRLALTPLRKAAEGMKNKGIEKTKLPWFDKTIRSVGHIIDIGEQINPSIFVKGFLDRALIAYRGTEDAIQTNTVLKMAALRQLGNDVWRVDTDVNSATYGDIQNLPPQKLREGGSTNFHDVLTYSDQFTFNDQQKKWIAIARDLLDEDLRLNREAGIDISELNFYHSINDAPEFVDVVGGTKRTAEGYYWPRVIQNTDDAEKGLVQGIPVGSEKSREKMREYLLARDANTAGIKYALTPDITLEKTLTAGAQSRRDMNFIKFMSDTNNPYFRKMVPDGPTFAQMKVGEFLKPEAVSNVYGDPSGAWAGKRFRGVLVTPEMDKALKKISRDLKVHDGAWIKNLQTINGAIRFLQTGYDVGHMFIQGQVALGGRREQWARASMAMFRAFLDPKLAQKKLGQDSAIIAEMAQRDAAPFLASEFVEASVSGLMSKLPFAQQFAAMFNMFMDQARIELYRSYRHRVLHKYGLEAPNARSAIDRSVIDATPGLARDLHEMVKAVDNMVGVSSARQLGVTETRQSIERAYLFYASNYRRGVGGAMVDFFQGGMRGEVARDAQGRAMMATMLFFGGAAIGLGQFDNSNRDRAPIIGSGAIFKPWDRRFMTLRIGGMELGLGGAYVSTYRFLGSLYGALTDSDGYQGKTDGIRDKVQRFMRSNTAPTTGAIADVFMDSDWKGDPVKNFPGAVTLFAERALPFWASPFITDGWLGEKPLSDVALGSGLSMTGLRESTASPRDVISTRELGEEYRNIEEPFLKDLILSLVNREHTFRETEFTELRDAEFNKLLNLSREIGLSEQQIVNKYFAIINEYRGRRDQAAGELHFPERKARSENEEALFAVWEMLASATTDAERRKGYEELEAQATPEQQAFVDRNLNRRMIPERLYLLLPRSVTEKLDDSLRLRVAYLQEIGRSDLIQEMRDSYIIKEEPDPADDGGVDRQVLDDLQKIRRSGYEDLMTDTAIAQWIKRRMDTSFSPYIEIYIDADRGKRGNLTTRSDDKAIYKQIESMLSNAGRKLKQRQLEFIDDLRKDGAYGDLEFLLWHYDRHPNENLRKRDAVFMKEYESWRGNRPAIGVG